MEYERRKDLETDGIEAIWLEITLPKSSPLLICFTYKPPEGSRHVNKNFLAKFEIMLEIAILEGKETILACDLNANYRVEAHEKDIKETLRINSLKQMIKQPTRTTSQSKTLIDTFCSNKTTTISVIIVKQSSISDHDIIGINRKIHSQKYKPRKIYTRDYS